MSYNANLRTKFYEEFNNCISSISCPESLDALLVKYCPGTVYITRSSDPFGISQSTCYSYEVPSSEFKGMIEAVSKMKPSEFENEFENVFDNLDFSDPAQAKEDAVDELNSLYEDRDMDFCDGGYMYFMWY